MKKVKKRNGRLEELNLDKINLCAEMACEDLDNVSVSEIVLDASLQLYDKIPTKEIDKALLVRRLKRNLTMLTFQQGFFYIIFIKKFSEKDSQQKTLKRNTRSISLATSRNL